MTQPNNTCPNCDNGYYYHNGNEMKCSNCNGSGVVTSKSDTPYGEVAKPGGTYPKSNNKIT
jgi:DnaJ-class molecular chaperone